MDHYPNETLNAVNELLRQGSVSRARAVLVGVLEKRIPRRQLLPVAELCRRAHLPWRAVQLLHRIVRPPARSALKATDYEIAEYAASLVAIGAPSEAMSLLSKVDTKAVPFALVHAASAQMWQWDWAAAIPFLRKFTALPAVAEIDRLWAELNLAQALIHGQDEFEESAALLAGVLSRSGPGKYRMVHKGALWASLQSHVLNRRWYLAREVVSTVAGLGDNLEDEDPIFMLVFDQWKSYLALGTSKDRAAAMREVRAVRERAKRMNRWENVRSCDYYEAKCFGNQRLLIQLIFGTPFPALRKKAIALLGEDKRLPAALDWSCFRKVDPVEVTVDVTNGRNSRGDSYLKEGQIPQRLLQILGSDFYRPMQLAEVHERLYPDQYFQPGSSQDRVHQALMRLRRWLEEQKLPLTVEETEGCYSLKTGDGCVLRVPAPEEAATASDRPRLRTKTERQLAVLRERFGKERFSAVNAAEHLSVSYRTTIRVLNELIRADALSRIERGPQTEYELKP